MNEGNPYRKSKGCPRLVCRALGLFLSEDDAGTDAEVVLRAAAEVRGVVVELDGADVNAGADAEVEAAADDRGEAVVSAEGAEAARTEARVLEADQRVRERFDLRVRRVVLELDATRERVEVNRVAVEVLVVERVVALHAEVAREVSCDGGLDAVEALAVAAEVNAVVREAAVDVVLVVVAARRGLRRREGRGAGDDERREE